MVLDNTSNTKFLLFDNLALQLLQQPCIELTGPSAEEVLYNCPPLIFLIHKVISNRILLPTFYRWKNLTFYLHQSTIWLVKPFFSRLVLSVKTIYTSTKLTRFQDHIRHTDDNRVCGCYDSYGLSDNSYETKNFKTHLMDSNL